MSCPDCFNGHVHEGTPRGKVTKLHGLDAYVTEPADGREVKAVIVIIPDAFGWEFVNNKILADNYADKGNYRVYLPEFMNGKAAPLWMIDIFRTLSNPGNYLKKAYSVPMAMYAFVPFLISNRAGVSYPLIKKFLQDMRQNEAKGMSIGVAGFCWGGKLVAVLAADTDKVDGRPLFDAGFTSHPSMLSVPGDVEKMQLPVSFAIGDLDTQVSVEQIGQIRKIVEAKPDGQKGEVTMYEGCGHGFCVRADTTFDDPARQAAEAEDQCIRWFDQHFGLGSK